MLIKSVNGKSPLIPEDCYVAENATIVGDVSLENLVVFGLMPC
jgi:carbonic anhydrase/acetyltransferase-like protein (isoleucine patch superfamily)